MSSLRVPHPKGVRGHTVYHQFSRGGISYARFAHLGKEGALGRYPIHFHLVEDTMRGSGVLGAAIVDSHNRWVTIHGTQYLLVRDCIGYRSVGHGFFMEDGTEVYNLLDRNLGVQAYRGKRLPKQVLGSIRTKARPSGGQTGGTRSLAMSPAKTTNMATATTARRGGYRQSSPVRMPGRTEQKVDIRTLPFFRFEANEAHTEGLYGMIFAGNNQHGSPITDRADFAAIDRTGPDMRHPHILRDVNIWEVHYALRPQIPTMMLDHVQIAHATYGIYRPALENHFYRDLRITSITSEPFNRGMTTPACSSAHSPWTGSSSKFPQNPYSADPDERQQPERHSREPLPQCADSRA